MGISNTQYRDIMFQYDQTRMDNQRILDHRHEELYQKIPELKEIHNRIVELSVEQAKTELLNPEAAKRIILLKKMPCLQEKWSFLKKAAIRLIT